MRLSQPALQTAAATVALAVVTVLGGCSSSPSSDAEARSCPGCRTPPVTATWQYQLQGRPQLGSARVYDLDGFDTPKAFVSRLRVRGRYSICYVDAGTWESWRGDRKRFPASVLGRPNGWPGERWLDIRRLAVLGPIMRERFEICRRKGFDAVEPDNVDGYSNRTGFPLTARHQLVYNRYLARTAHRLGLAVGLKNDLDQVTSLHRSFDFAVVEQCFQYDECGKLRPFMRTKKPVFEVEYELPRSRFCARAKELRINALRSEPDLDRPGVPC